MSRFRLSLCVLPFRHQMTLRLHVSDDLQIHSVWKGLQEGYCVAMIDIHKAVSIGLGEENKFYG